MSPIANVVTPATTKSHAIGWEGRLRATPTTIAAAEPRLRSPHRYKWYRGSRKMAATSGALMPTYTHGAIGWPRPGSGPRTDCERTAITWDDSLVKVSQLVPTAHPTGA